MGTTTVFTFAAILLLRDCWPPVPPGALLVEGCWPFWGEGVVASSGLSSLTRTAESLLSAPAAPVPLLALPLEPAAFWERNGLF